MTALSTRVSDLATRIATEIKTVKAHYSGNNQGSLTSLTTTEKSSLLGAINEVNSNKEVASKKGAANGYAGLDANGKVPSTQLPSYVDDVEEYANLAAFPVTGESSKIYIAIDTNLTYRWGGSNYVNISSALALGETSSTAYRGDRGKAAYDHSQAVTGNPHAVTYAQLGGTKPTYTYTEVGAAASGHDHSGVYSVVSHDHSGVYSIAAHTHTGVYEPANSNIQTHIALANAHIDWTNAASNFKTSGTVTLDNSAVGDSILTIKGKYDSYKRILFSDEFSADRGRIQFGASSTIMQFWLGGSNLTLSLYDTGKIKLGKYGVGTFTGTKAYYPVLDSSGFLIELSSIPWADISSTPTSLSGYGITDAYTKTEIGTPDTNFVTVFEAGLV
jgi:hypothetical protein